MARVPGRRRARAGERLARRPGRRSASALLVGLAPLAWLLARSTPESVRPGGGRRRDAAAARAAADATRRSRRRCARRRSGSSRSPARSTASSPRASGSSTSRSWPSAASTPDDLPPRAGGHGDHRRSPATSRPAPWPSAARCARVLVGRACCCSTGALAALPHVTTTAHVMAQAVAMGLAGGFVMVVFFSFWGRAYGRAHLGRIQGAAQMLTVLASARRPAAPRLVRRRRPARTPPRSTRWPRSWPRSRSRRWSCRCPRARRRSRPERVQRRP